MEGEVRSAGSIRYFAQEFPCGDLYQNRTNGGNYSSGLDDSVSSVSSSPTEFHSQDGGGKAEIVNAGLRVNIDNGRLDQNDEISKNAKSGAEFILNTVEQECKKLSEGNSNDGSSISSLSSARMSYEKTIRDELYKNAGDAADFDSIFRNARFPAQNSLMNELYVIHTVLNHGNESEKKSAIQLKEKIFSLFIAEESVRKEKNEYNSAFEGYSSGNKNKEFEALKKEIKSLLDANLARTDFIDRACKEISQQYIKPCVIDYFKKKFPGMSQESMNKIIEADGLISSPARHMLENYKVGYRGDDNVEMSSSAFANVLRTHLLIPYYMRELYADTGAGEKPGSDYPRGHSGSKRDSIRPLRDAGQIIPAAQPGSPSAHIVFKPHININIDGLEKRPGNCTDVEGSGNVSGDSSKRTEKPKQFQNRGIDTRLEHGFEQESAPLKNRGRGDQNRVEFVRKQKGKTESKDMLTESIQNQRRGINTAEKRGIDQENVWLGNGVRGSQDEVAVVSKPKRAKVSTEIFGANERSIQDVGDENKPVKITPQGIGANVSDRSSDGADKKREKQAQLASLSTAARPTLVGPGWYR